MTRVLRLCDVCFQLDDHPRHVTALDPAAGGGKPDDLSQVPDGVPTTALAELLMDDSHVRHMDCCAAAGCASCQAQVDLAQGASGTELIAHLLDNAEEHYAITHPDEV